MSIVDDQKDPVRRTNPSSASSGLSATSGKSVFSFNKPDKRGFMFTVTVFLVLVYILLSVSVWVKSVEASERSFSEFYKESTIELTMDQITPEKLDNVTYIIMNRALMRLNDHTIDYPVDHGSPVDENQNIRAALFELFMNGSANDSYFRGGVGIPSENSSLTAWAQNLNASLHAIGLYLNTFQVSNFHIGQNDIDAVNYSFDVMLSLRDYTNMASVSRTYHISNAVSISGLVDPALARESRRIAGDNMTIYREFLFQKTIYPDSASMTSQITQPIEAGQGWIYAPLALASGSDPDGLMPNAASVPIASRRYYVLVGSFSDITSLDDYEEFAGFIVNTSAVVSEDGCTNGAEGATFNPIHHSRAPECAVEMGSDGVGTSKPYMIAPGFNAVSSAPECGMVDGSNVTGRCILMVNSYSEGEVAADLTLKHVTGHSGLFNVEAIRDFVMCGYYTHNPNAPSYLQRLMDDSYSYTDPMGIETFVIGAYAGDYDIYDTRGRLDRELFNTELTGLTRVRGLPGCRDFGICSDSPPTGIFVVSNTTAENYGLGSIACTSGAARCTP